MGSHRWGYIRRLESILLAAKRLIDMLRGRMSCSLRFALQPQRGTAPRSSRWRVNWQVGLTHKSAIMRIYFLCLRLPTNSTAVSARSGGSSPAENFLNRCMSAVAPSGFAKMCVNTCTVFEPDGASRRREAKP